MKIEHFILANNSSIDLNSNALSVFGILDDMQVQAPAGVAINLNFHAILVVKRDEELGEIRTQFVMTVHAPNGAMVGQEMRLPIQLQSVHRRSRLRVIADVPITHSGAYRVRMTCVDHPALSSEVSLNIQILPVAVPSPASPITQ